MLRLGASPAGPVPSAIKIVGTLVLPFPDLGLYGAIPMVIGLLMPEDILNALCCRAQ